MMALAAGLTLLPRPAAAQEVGRDVPPGHWAYQAVQDLASKGLIKGYPPDGNFLGGRTLTRYEMATILQRVVARMDDLITKAASKEDVDKLNSSQAEIRELVDNFKTEMVVIGTDMQKVQADLAVLKGQVSDLSSRVGSLSQKVDDTAIKADQALENVKQLQESTNAALAKKVDVGTGHLRIGGLFQIWYGTAFGGTLGGNFPTNYSLPTPPGRTYGGGVGSTFELRRGEISFDGDITPRAYYHAMIDVAKTGTGAGSPLQDLLVGYQLFPHWRLEVGQQVTGLSEEGSRSSAELLTIARSIMNEDLPPDDGRIGRVRDTGAVLRYQSAPVSAFLGIWNGNGDMQNTLDTNRQMFLDGSLYYTGIHRVLLGVWGGTEVGSSNPAAVHDRAGATFLYHSGPNTLEAEFGYARDYAAGAPGIGRNGTISDGGYLLYANALSRKWQLVARYDIWDPAAENGNPSITETGITIPASDHKLKEYTFGVNYYLRGTRTKIQLNYIREDVETNGLAFFGKPRDILLSNFQVGF